MRVFAATVVTAIICTIVGFLGYLGLSAAGNPGLRSRVTNYQPDLEIPQYVKNQPVRKTTGSLVVSPRVMLWHVDSVGNFASLHATPSV